MKVALLTLTSLIGIATMSINVHATEPSLSAENPTASAHLIPERFIRSINDDRNLDYQTLYPPSDAKGIQIMRNSDLVIDSHGNLYVTGPKLINDRGFGASSLSKITPAGAVSILTLSMNKQLTSITIDSQDNIYLSVYSGSSLGDSNAGGGGYSLVPKFLSDLTRESNYFTVRKLQPDGHLSMFIPKNKSEWFFNFAVDSNGVLYSNSYLRLIKITDRRVMGRKTESLIDFSVGSISVERSASAMVTDGDNNLVYVEHNVPSDNSAQVKPTRTDDSYDLIKRISTTGDISDIAGVKAAVNSNDGIASKAGFKNVSSLAIDSKGSIYVLEAEKKTIRKISGGVVSTLVSDTGADALSIAIQGTDLYILRQTGIDVVRNLPL